MTAPESLSSLGARGVALAQQVGGAETQCDKHPMTAPESFSSLGFRFLALAQQAENSATLVSILEGQIRSQQKAIEEARAILNAVQGQGAAEAANVPVKGLSRPSTPGD